MRIVIEDGDELRIASLRAAAAAAAPDAADGGAAPIELIRRHAEGAELAELAQPEAEVQRAEAARAPDGADEPPLNPLRAGAAVARGEGLDGGVAPASPGGEP